MRTFFYVVVLVLMSAILGGGQIRNNSVVDARTALATDAAHPNSNLKMAVVAQVAPGYHINDHKPTLDYLIATELKLDPTDQVAVTNTIYPKGTLRKFAFSDVSLSVYEGTVMVGAILQVAKAAPPGSYALKGKFAYQACNDHACLPPTSVPVSVTVKVVPRAVPLKPVDSDVFQRIQFE
jgi:thiol:disulfide interchange protein DsbD